MFGRAIYFKLRGVNKGFFQFRTSKGEYLQQVTSSKALLPSALHLANTGAERAWGRRAISEAVAMLKV